MGRAPERSGIPCTTCELYHVMQGDQHWLTEDEIWPKGHSESGILVSIIPELSSGSEVTHVDIAIAKGHQVDRMLLARPPKATRFEVGSTYSVCLGAEAEGDYTIYAFPKRLDPNFRKQYPAMPPVTLAIKVMARPIAQEFRLHV